MFEKILSHGDLLVVIVGLLSIWLMGAFTRLLQSLQPQDIFYDEFDRKPTQSVEITAVPFEELKNLKRLVEREDKLQIAIFFATYQCTLEDVAKINESLKTTLNPYLDNILPLSEEMIQNLYQSDGFRELSSEQKSSIETYQLADNKVIDKTFIKQFGGIVFMENFIMYQHLCHADSAYFHIPKGNELRRMFETFAAHDLAKTGKEIPIGDRIRGIDWSRLQMLAGKLGMNRFLHDREDAIQQLSEKPLIEEILDRDFPAEDDYLLVKKDWDFEKVEVEWRVYNAFAEIVLASQRSAQQNEASTQLETIKTGKEVAV